MKRVLVALVAGLLLTTTSSSTQSLAVLQVTVTGAYGSVVSSPAGINNGGGGPAPATFAIGTTVTLTATPLPGYRLVGWSGDCSGTAATCAVLMDRARSVTATFRYVLPQTDTVEFVSNGLSVFEGDTSLGDVVIVTTPTDQPTTHEIRVDYASSASTATSGVDFQSVSGTLVIPAGTPSGTQISLGAMGIHPDAVNEPHESFWMWLSNPTGAAVGARSLLSVTIIGNGFPQTRSVGFTTTGVATGEHNFNFGDFLAVTTSDGAPLTEDVSVSYFMNPGTAVAGLDYYPIGGTIVWPAGTPSGSTPTKALMIYDDGLAESTETLSILLSGPVNASYGSISILPVSVFGGSGVANPLPVKVSLTSGSMAMDEGARNVYAWLQVTTADGKPLPNRVDVYYDVLDGSAQSSVDYSFTGGHTVWEAGDASGSRSSIGPFNVTEDQQSEGIETLRLFLRGPTNATFGTYPSMAITISDQDPLVPQQWHLKGPSQEPFGINAISAWPLSRGEGIGIGIFDRPANGYHEDILPNFLGTATRYPQDWTGDTAGTELVGLAGARGGNGIGGSGVAPMARVMGSDVPPSLTDSAFAYTLTHALSLIDIASFGAGPADDGASSWGPGPLSKTALATAVRDGRNGKGRVLVWPAGNGRQNLDDCNHDGFANSRYAMAVGAVTRTGASALSESCSALFVVAPSDEAPNPLITTSNGASNTAYGPSSGHVTSASASIVAGVSALILGRNPELTWRDVQSILRVSSSRAGLQASDWTAYPVPHSERFGFGNVDAVAAVRFAESWSPILPEQQVPADQRTVNLDIPDNNTSGLTDVITIPAAYASFLTEHIEVEFSATHQVRGQIEVTLTSPAGVQSHLTPGRPNDTSPAGYDGWTFSSVRHWGESAAGQWQLRVRDRVSGGTGRWLSWRLRIYGTPPPHFNSGGPLRLESLTSDAAAPQAAGSTVTFTAVADGGAAPYQFKWWVYDGSWRDITGWTTSHTFAWTPTSANANYRIGVWVRSGTSSADASDNDNSNGSTSFPITALPAPPSTPVSLGPLSANLVAPQNAGTAITFTVPASGGTTPYQFKWRVYDGSTWSVVRDWAAGNTFTWTPPAASPYYYLGVWARSAGATADVPESERTMAFPVTAPPPPPSTPAALSLVSLLPDLSSPRAAGTTITFIATATGGTAPYEYKWWRYDGAWQAVTQWTSSATYAWTPASAFAGYKIGVWVRSAGRTVDASDNDNSNTSINFAITPGNPPAATPLSLTALTANLTAPQSTGTPVTFTASASGGSSPYHYKFRLHDGTGWAVVRDWSPSNTFVWTPSTANAAYQIGVWIRSAGASSDVAEAEGSVAFAISPGAPVSGPLQLQSLTPDRSAPQATGTTITFTASATGGTGPYQYKWWKYDGVWQTIGEWSTSNTLAWTPTVAFAGYKIGVWVRSATSTADASDNDTSNTSLAFAITAGAPPPPPTPAALVLTALTADRNAPQVAGTSMTLATTASGGTAPHQYKWRVFDGTSWTVLRDWAPGPSLTWTPATANAGYQLNVWARSASATADTAEAEQTLAFAITSAPSGGGPLRLVSFAADVTAPQAVGTTITFTAVATGGTGPYQYRWWKYDGSWQTVTGWTTSATYAWTPASVYSGYRIGVWVRSAGTAADASDNDNSNTSLAFPIAASAPPAPASISSLTADYTAPQPAGTAVTFTATATGGATPYQYKWRLWDGSAWTVLRDWAVDTNYVWWPPSANPNYQINVWVRSAGLTTDAPNDERTLPFAVVAPAPGGGPLSLLSLSPNLSAPQAPGTTLTFTAIASGGSAPYQYKWWIYDGTWRAVTDWTTSATFAWTPQSRGSNYRIGVWVRSAGVTTDASDNDGSNGSTAFTITQ